MRYRWMHTCLLLVAAANSLPAADDFSKMKFQDVKEVAPGVFFRYSAISATDEKVVFGGSNNIWIIFEDYVVVVDANFPTGAKEVIAAVKKTTDKPIRYVFDTHHHGDHAYGNEVFAKEGASIIAQTNCARLLRINVPKEFEDAGKGSKGRPDVADSKLRVPNVVFDEKLVLEDSKQRVEFRFFGHAHTAGDACAYLPQHKILCTGDACVNGAFNYMGHSDSESWIRALEKMQQLDIKLICPGHGLPTTKDLLETQKRWFVDLRQQVQKGIDADKKPEEIAKGLDIGWFKEWSGAEASARKENVEHVYDELTGRITPWDLVEDFGVYEGPSPTKDDKDWTKPKRILVPNLMPARMAELKRLAPDIEFVPARDAEEAAKLAGDVDAVIGYCTPDIVAAGKRLRWIQVAHAGVEKDLFPEIVKSKILMTNTQRLFAPHVADQGFALLLGLTRGGGQSAHVEDRPTQPKLVPRWDWLKNADIKPLELRGKTMLVVGLGGIGTECARRASAFGMRVMAIDPKDNLERPDFVFSLDKPDRLMQLLPKADVVFLACPLTKETTGLVGPEQFKAMKNTCLLINVARGGVVQTQALVDALEKKQIAGAGMDVTDPEPLPDNHPLWKMHNVVISPHIGGQSEDGMERQWRLYRENVRRFVAGEKLLCVVDKAKGY